MTEAPRLARRVVLAGPLLAAAACSQSSGGGSLPPLVEIAAAFGGLQFNSAVDLQQHPTDDQRWYVLEQGGVVETFLATDPAGTRTTVVALTGLLTSGENGLLGMAFHPDFATTGEVFLSYVVDTGGAAGTSVIARFLSPDNGLTFVADPGPDPLVLTLVQPYANHNGGDIDFGPDGYLYIAFGDGGGGGDPDGNGQDITDWFGSILRLDVDSARPYAIPVDNPFVGVAGADELWCYGLRNPWRMSFDPATGMLWAGDVGQSRVEEIDVIVRGGNYGWSLQEGNLCYPSGMQCSLPGLIAPVAIHSHAVSESITGGFVYHGAAIPQLADHYIYGDFVQGRVFALDTLAMSNGPEQLFQAALNISSFGQARNGEIYLVGYGAAERMWLIVPLPP